MTIEAPPPGVVIEARYDEGCTDDVVCTVTGRTTDVVFEYYRRQTDGRPRCHLRNEVRRDSVLLRHELQHLVAAVPNLD